MNLLFSFRPNRTNFTTYMTLFVNCKPAFCNIFYIVASFWRKLFFQLPFDPDFEIRIYIFVISLVSGTILVLHPLYCSSSVQKQLLSLEITVVIGLILTIVQVNKGLIWISLKAGGFCFFELRNYFIFSVMWFVQT